MTVNNSANKVIAAGNGVQTVFGFAFIAVQASDLQVILTDSSGNETTLLPANYTVALNPTPPGQIWSIGGTVTYPLVGSPIPTGSTLTLVRELSLTQLVALGNQGNEFPSAVEAALDLLEMQLQQVSELFQRAIVAPVVDPTAPLPLPPVAQRANQGMGFDASGNPVALALPASGVISSAMQPVVNAASLAAGRLAFGLRAMAQEGIGAGLQDDGSNNARVNSALTSVATNQAVDATFAQNIYVITGPINFTLARANTLWNGFSFAGFVLGSALTLVPDANDAIQGQASGAPVAVPANSFFRIMADAAASGNWRIDWAPFNVDGASKSLIGPVAFGAVRGLTITNNAGTPNTKIDVAAADAVMINPSGYGIKAAAVAVTIDLTTGSGTSTANGMDGEAIPANGDLFVWLISNGVTTAGLASSSSTAPTMPTGYTFKKYIGAMKTAASILKRTLQKGRNTQYVVSVAGTTALPIIVSGSVGSPTAPTWVASSIAAFVPATASEIGLVLVATGSLSRAIAAPNNLYGGINSGVNLPALSSLSTSSTLNPIPGRFILESTNIYFAADTGVLACSGWTDNNI